MMQNTIRKKTRAFSLMELLIAIAIIGILSGISYPIYQHHLVKTRRVRATIMLINLAAEMEQYYFKNHSYQDASFTKLKSKTGDKYYRLEIATANETKFLLKAVPIKQQAKNDPGCATLTLNQNNIKNITGTGLLSECWD